MRERLMISVTFDPQRGYVTAGNELPLAALSLSGLRRRIEDAHRGEDVEIKLVLDRVAGSSATSAAAEVPGPRRRAWPRRNRFLAERFMTIPTTTSPN